VLDRRDGITQTELADYLELDKSTIGRLLDRLEERGFIRREKDPNDRRIFRIFIAKTAYPVLTELEQVADGVRAQALSGISEKDNEKLLALLGQVKKNLIAAREGS
jgi:DNA-binding MarR family transcriptional regulator